MKRYGQHLFPDNVLKAMSEDLYYIGIHIRRGMDIDMNEKNRRHGHIAAPADYYKRAMDVAKSGKENASFNISLNS
ncbi:unnamed protein product [Cylicostephanus goldi]|uniref:L-Fucosyltransferase n=1 Tax=Cylicostephanus goldi TaxID=71465 RepID=A0A3P6T6H4_CYLGO|nr:unnamed protein product [Cylicostephanus goldi]